MAESPSQQLTEIERNKLAAELFLCSTDKNWLFSRHYWIRNDKGEITKMGKLRRAQRKLLAVLRWCKEHNVPARIAVGKSRKQGVTTGFAAWVMDRVISGAVDAMVIAHDKETAHYIFGIYQRFYRYLDMPKPPPYKGKLNRREMRFDGHEGIITVETANNVFAGTGRTPQIIHASESAKWERGQETLISLHQSMGDDPSTVLVHECTFNGNESTFLPLWKTAVDNSRLSFRELPDGDFEVDFEVTNREEWNGFIPLFLSVLEDETRRRPFQDDEEKVRFLQTLDDYEKMILETTNASPEFLNWRRFTIKHKCQGDLAIFKQEYPITWHEAVRASGRPRFDIEALDAMPCERGENGYLLREEKWSRRILWKHDKGEVLTRFRDVVPGHRYVIGVDTAEGIMDEAGKKPDASVAIVLDLDHGGEQVATYAGQINPEHMIEPINLLGLYYNEAYIVPEANGAGDAFARELAKIYPPEKMYHRNDWDSTKTRRTSAIGWRTTVTTRPTMIRCLASAIEDGDILLHDQRTVLESKGFVFKDGGRVEAERGSHDDHVFALGLAVMGMQTYPETKSAAETRKASLAQRQALQTADSVTGY